MAGTVLISVIVVLAVITGIGAVAALIALSGNAYRG